MEKTKPNRSNLEKLRCQHIDYFMLFLVTTIIMFGLVMVFSSSISIADRTYGNPFYFFNRQLISIFLGGILSIICFFIPIKFWNEFSSFILIGTVILLILVLIPGVGKEVNGSSRWISIGFLNLQVSELAKLGFIVYLSSYLQRKSIMIQISVKSSIPPFVFLVILGLLLLLEPDMGATVVIACIFIGLIFIAGTPLLSFIMASFILLMVASALIIFEPYRYARLVSFTNPWANPFDIGFQLTQSLMSIAGGGWFGVGLGNSIQKQFYLPEAHTDFIFAIIAEELGLMGAIFIICLLSLLVYRIFLLAIKSINNQNLFEAYLLFGFSIWIGIQSFINIGVTMGVLPTKGITLPFISYGGSSLLVMMIVMGIVFRINHELESNYEW
jgi:cell division protein FtsW